MTYIITKKYEHYNRSLGKYITSKKHYESEMAKGGFVSYEKGQQMAESARAKNHKDYKGLSNKTMKFLNEVKQMADKKGNIKPSDRFIDGLKKHGVNIGRTDIPKGVKLGGFYE